MICEPVFPLNQNRYWNRASFWNGERLFRRHDLHRPEKTPPSSPPILTELTLVLPPEGGPQRPVTSSSPAALQGGAPSIILREKDSTTQRTTAEQDPRVREHLGERFGFIETEEVYPDQCVSTAGEEGSDPGHLTERPATQDRAHRLTYYSYSQNSAIQVCLQGDHVTSVHRDPRPGYQPQEGQAGENI